MTARQEMEDGMDAGEFVFAGAAASAGFVTADWLDRLLATYDPSGTTKPTDKFTSDGAGTLANTLNVASAPGAGRLIAGVALAAAPAVGSMFVEEPIVAAGLEGAAIGAGINLFKTLWNNVLMPMIIGTDTSTPALQKSHIARLYPSEVAAKINKAQRPTATGALSDSSPYPDAGQALHQLTTGVHGESPYPSAGQALSAGLHGDSPYADAAQALRAGVSGDSPYADAAQALRAGVGADPAVLSPPAPPPTTVAPPAVVAATAAKIADVVSSALPGISAAQADVAAAHIVAAPPTPAHVEAALATALPHVDPAKIQAVAKNVHPHVARLHGQSTSSWQPGPPPGFGPGPQSGKACGCVGDPSIGFAGFLGEPSRDVPSPLWEPARVLSAVGLAGVRSDDRH